MRFILAIIVGAIVLTAIKGQDDKVAELQADTSAVDAVHDLVARVESLEQRRPEAQCCPVSQTDLLTTARLAAIEERLTALESKKQAVKAELSKPKTRLQLAKEDAADNNPQLLLVFHRPGCAACAKLEAYLRSIQHAISDRYLVVTADVTDEDVRDFRIPSTPTAFIYDPRTGKWGRPLTGADVYAMFQPKGNR